MNARILREIVFFPGLDIDRVDDGIVQIEYKNEFLCRDIVVDFALDFFLRINPKIGNSAVDFVSVFVFSGFVAIDAKAVINDFVETGLDFANEDALFLLLTRFNEIFFLVFNKKHDCSGNRCKDLLGKIALAVD